MQDNILSFIGIMRKAGALALGAEAVFDAIEVSRAKLIITAADASTRTKNGVKNACNYENTPIINLSYTKEELGGAVGYGGCGIAAVLNTGFAKSLADKLNKTDIAEGLELRMDREKRRRAKKLAAANTHHTTEKRR